MGQSNCLLARCARVPGLLLLVVLWFIPSLPARDVFVMLSGGVSPMNNNYSQYLQAKAVTAWLNQTYPRDSQWVFFGAGNVEGQKPVFGDVRRKVKRDGLILDSWLPGALPHNRPARRDAVLRAFRDEILPAVANGGTLFLFVGDHGSRTDGKDSQSILNLWEYAPDAKAEHGWRSDQNQALSVADLRNVLVHGLGRGRVVFCMTQCHSGGFHFLGMPHDMIPNPAWFTVAPLRGERGDNEVFPLAAGFTATDEFSVASGCDPDPDPDHWAGYERFLPESLLGLDLFSLKPKGQALSSFAEAHVSATLVDCTIDKPYSTSEQYLERWADLIETRLVTARDLKTAIKKQVAAYQRAVNGGTVREIDPAWRDRQALFHRFTEKLTDQNPTVRRLLLTGTRTDLERTIDGGDPADRATPQPDQTQPGDNPPPRPGRRGRRGGNGQNRRLWSSTLRPAWKAAIEASQVIPVPAGALGFEKYLLSQETDSRDFFSGRGRSRMTDEIFWHSGYSDPKTLDPAKAEAVSRWGVERRAKILTWARASDDSSVRAAAEALSPASGQSRRNPASPPRTDLTIWPMRRDVAAERALFYRRVLAAWEFLLAVNERPALARLRELSDLERTPLPRSK